MADNDFRVVVGLGLKSDAITDLQNDIGKINLNPVPVEIKLNAKDANDKIDALEKKIKALNNIQIKIPTVPSGGSSGGKGGKSKELETTYKKLQTVSKNIGSIYKKLPTLDATKDIQQIKVLESQLQSFTKQYHKCVEKIKNSNKGDLTESQWQNIQNQIDDTGIKVQQLTAKFADVKANLSQGITLKFNDGTIDNEVSKLNSSLSQIRTQSSQVTTSFQQFNTALTNLNLAINSGDMNAIIAANDRYEQALKEVKNQIDINIRAEKDLDNAQKKLKKETGFDLNKKNALLGIDTWLKDNSAAAKQFGKQIDELRNKINACDNQADLNNIKKEFQLLQKKVKDLGLNTQTYFDKFKSQVSKLGIYYSASAIFMHATQAMREMYDNVLKIDTAMTELIKVTSEADETYNQFLDNIGNRAQKIGTTVDGLISSTADFARLGYSFDEAQKLAEVANIYAVVGDEIDGVDQATESLVSTLTAFGHEVDAMGIIDKFNEIGNNFAISSGGIGEALKRSASSLAAANNTLDESIALITAANTVVQDPESVGTAFKTVSMRIRGAKTELEAAGLETEGMAESTAKMREEIMALTGVDIMLDENTFKGTYEILDEIADKWGELSDIQRASVTELIAGKRQGNIISSLMQNFDIAREALDKSMDSEGSALEEHEKWSESLQAHINGLIAAWQDLSQTVLNSDLLKTGISILTELIKFVDNLIEHIGIGSVLLFSFGAKSGIGSFIKALSDVTIESGKISKLTDVINVLGKAFPNAKDGVKIFTSALASGTKGVGLFTTAVRSLWAVLSKHPVGLAISAVILLGSAFLNAKSGAEKAEEAMDDAFSKYDEAKSKVESVNSELETTEARMRELENKKGLTFVEQEELEKLRESTELLQIQAQLAKDEEIKAAKEAASAAIDAYNENFKHEISKNATDEEEAYADSTGNNSYLFIDESNMSAMLAGIRQMKELREEAEQGSDDWEHFNSMIEETESTIKSQLGVLNDYYNDLDAIPVEELTDEQKAFKEMLHETIEYVYSELDPAKWKDIQFGKIFDDEVLAREKQKLVEYAKEHSRTGLTIKDVWGKLSPELEVAIYKSGFKVQDFVNYVNSEAGIKKIATTTEEVAKSVGVSLEDIFNIDDSINLDNFKQAYQEYKNIVDEANEKQIDVNRTVFGNIDTNNRQILQWTEENLKKYEDALESLGHSTEGMLWSSSTVLGGSNNYNGIEIAFSPMLQTPNGAVVLSQDTVDKYIYSLIDKATEDDGTWTNEELFSLDVTGLEIDGQKINNLLADIGETAIKTGEAMHYVGQNGAIEEAYNNLLNIANASGVNETKLFDLIDSDSFINEIDNHIAKVNMLQQALEDYSNGEFSNKDLEELTEIFPELSDDTENFEKNVKSLIFRLNEDAISKFAEQFDDINSEEAREQLQKLQDGVLELGDVVGNTLFSIDMQVESEGIEKLVAAMKESVSSTGLTSESIKNLKDRYKGLKDADFAKLFEETTNGIHLNTKELRKLEREYQNLRKSEINEELNDLIDKYDILTEAIGNSSDAARTSELYKQRESIINQINDLATLASQYDGLTSAYYNWENAQSNGNERDMYEGIISGKEELEEEMSRGWLDDDARAYLELLSGRDLSTAKYDELLEVYKNLNKEIEKGYTAFDFFTVDEDGNSTSEGVFNFLDVVLEKQKELGQEWVKIVDGEYVFDFGVNGDKAVAEALGISEELVQIILRAAEDAGFEVNLNSAYTELADLEDAAKQAYDALKQLKLDKYIDFELNLETSDIDKINEQIESAKTNLKLFTDSDGTVNLNVEGAEEAQTLLIALLTRKQELNAPSVMSVDTTKAETDIENVISLLQDYQRNYNNIEISTAVGADTTKAQTEIQNVLKSLDEIDEDTLISLGLNTKEFNTAVDTLLNTKVDVEAGVNLDEASLQVVQTTISSITPELMVKAGIDASAIVGYTPEDKESKVVYIVDDKEVDKYKAPVKKGVVEYTAKLNNWTVPKKYGVVEYKAKIEDAKVEVNGTANAQGTTGNAFSQGNWGTKDSGVALGGELGQELVVRGNRFFTIGDNSAEFFKYQKGDIIFNHEQTKQILENGKITKGIKRGKTFASGNAFVEGTAFSDGSGAGRHTIATVAGTYSKKGSGSDSDSKSKKEAEELKETFDWIEVAIDRIERAIDNLDLKASSAYKEWSKRNGFLKDEIIDIQKEMDIQASAEQRYLKEANKVNLDEKYKQLVRNGAIDIEIIEAIGESNVDNKQELIDNINLYKEWYEKSLDCSYAVDELSESLSECYETAFDNVVAQYEGMLSIIEHEKSMIDEYIAQSEAKGWVVSTKYYEALMDYEEDNIAKLQEEKQALLNSLQDGMANGGIEKGSEAWYNMVNSIDEVTLAIEESNTALLEYQNSIREIEWEVFDMIREQVSYVTDEANFLIDLMSNKKLYDDKGQLTEYGLSSMGMHGMNYNIYMEESKAYAEEMLKIEKQLAKNPYDKELIARKQELIELQQESIIAAEDEKQAIVDMVQEGIELELDALQERIDLYNESLDSAKNLYEYEKKIASQTKNIASLRKQLSSLENDDSEETRAKVQQLRLELQEAEQELKDTEYERFVDDTQKMLDDLYDKYSEILNSRLDNVDALISDMINDINENASTINETITEVSNAVGYTLSETMTSTWASSTTAITQVLADYGGAINSSIATSTTTLYKALTNLSSSISGMMNAIDDSVSVPPTSSSNSQQANTPTGSNVNSNKDTDKKKEDANKKEETNTNKDTSNKKENSSNTINKGSTVSVPSSAKIYDYAGDTSGERQYYRNNPTYVVLNEKNGYVQVRHSSLKSGITGWFKKSDIKGYATGKQNFLSDEIAWTQEQGREFIIRPSDGAILTPIAKGDSVLNAGASDNIWQMANNPTDFIKDNLKLDVANTHVGNGGYATYTQNLDNVVFNFPNVKSYNEMLNAMKSDKNFERLIMSMTIDQIAGKSSLAKGKSVR